MKLQKQKSDYERDYHKYVVVIPNEIVVKSELKEGDELEAEASKHQIILKKSLK
jgi:bifunctional DNA-binding transcriptional regulator/antitoxin component of YhaV-PrlF toxin-antitoxin module